MSHYHCLIDSFQDSGLALQDIVKECFGTQSEVELASRLSISQVMPR